MTGHCPGRLFFDSTSAERPFLDADRGVGQSTTRLVSQSPERTRSSSCHRACSLVTPPSGSGVSLGSGHQDNPCLLQGLRGRKLAPDGGGGLSPVPCPRSPSLQWADVTVCAQLAQPRRHPRALVCHLALSTPSVTSCSVCEPHGPWSSVPHLAGGGCLTPRHPLWPPVLGEPRGYTSALHAFASQYPSRHQSMPGDATRTRDLPDRSHSLSHSHRVLRKHSVSSLPASPPLRSLSHPSVTTGVQRSGLVTGVCTHPRKGACVLRGGVALGGVTSETHLSLVQVLWDSRCLRGRHTWPWTMLLGSKYTAENVLSSPFSRTMRMRCSHSGGRGAEVLGEGELLLGGGEVPVTQDGWF